MTKGNIKNLMLSTSIVAMCSIFSPTASLATPFAAPTCETVTGGQTVSNTHCQNEAVNSEPTNCSHRGTCNPPPPPPPPPRSNDRNNDNGGRGNVLGNDGSVYSDRRRAEEHGGGVRNPSVDRSVDQRANRGRDNDSGGGGGGGGGGGRVICTFFYNNGELSENDFYADTYFTLKHLPKAMVRGYHFWAIPYVQHMYKNPNGLATKLIRPIA
ncbi:MAG: hypothetical protein AAF988_00700, partial [Pseudomonadota bacterium]